VKDRDNVHEKRDTKPVGGGAGNKKKNYLQINKQDKVPTYLCRIVGIVLTGVIVAGC
jgi:hypothetical protein